MKEETGKNSFYTYIVKIKAAIFQVNMLQRNSRNIKDYNKYYRLEH